ncbi:sulfotransferase family 2 domain-containing protein [Thalassotalea sediminis]|uniref:sulfotransferase family 2 domain-containing protein n=1 Tax=Thalassotalea sediminis TaxID=1759089 RepID=UPI0025735EFC|nr:sulfotransferase family 2 domain-containing protein [Thalassotalea sediminis]
MKKHAKSLIKHFSQSLGYELTVNRVAKEKADTKPIVFVHIPKCGGISVDRALREQLARPGEKRLRRKPIIATSLHNFNRDISTLDDKCDFSEFHCQQIQSILTYHLNLNWHYVSGHINVTKRILDAYSEQYNFVTLLRDPVDRLISNYIFNKLTNKFAIMPPSIATKPMTKEELWREADQLLNSRRGWHMANTMTMFLTGRYPKDEQDAKNMQNEVLDNLSKFSVVGQLTKMQSFEQDLSQLIGKPIHIGRHNTTKAIEDNNALFVRESLNEYFAQESVKDNIKILCNNETIIISKLPKFD